jgi:hypothetical protein
MKGGGKVGFEDAKASLVVNESSLVSFYCMGSFWVLCTEMQKHRLEEGHSQEVCKGYVSMAAQNVGRTHLTLQGKRDLSRHEYSRRNGFMWQDVWQDKYVVVGYADADCYANTDYAMCRVTRRSTTGFVFTWYGTAVHYGSLRQDDVTLSRTAAECTDVAAYVATVGGTWFRMLCVIWVLMCKLCSL